MDDECAGYAARMAGLERRHVQHPVRAGGQPPSGQSGGMAERRLPTDAHQRRPQPHLGNVNIPGARVRAGEYCDHATPPEQVVDRCSARGRHKFVT